MLTGSFHFSLALKDFPTTLHHVIQLAWNSHQFSVALFIWTSYSVSWKILSIFSTWKLSASSPVRWHLPWKISLYSPRQSWLFLLAWRYIYHSAFHIFLQIITYIHVCSQAKLSAPKPGLFLIHFCIPTTFYYAFHSWHYN